MFFSLEKQRKIKIHNVNTATKDILSYKTNNIQLTEIILGITRDFFKLATNKRGFIQRKFFKSKINLRNVAIAFVLIAISFKLLQNTIC